MSIHHKPHRFQQNILLKPKKGIMNPDLKLISNGETRSGISKGIMNPDVKMISD